MVKHTDRERCKPRSAIKIEGRVLTRTVRDRERCKPRSAIKIEGRVLTRTVRDRERAISLKLYKDIRKT
jgi:hypothetical protein